MRTALKKLACALLAIAPAAGFSQDTTDGAAAAMPADPVAEYEQLLRDTRGLEAYNALVRRQIAMQEQDLANVQQAITEVPDLERQLPPLLMTMVDGLDEFIEMDLPFLQAERSDRLANLQLLIEDPDANDAQKLRQILSAWSVEVEYGGAFLTESGEVMIDGAPRAVDFVILGRIGLLYQTSDDEALTGAWDHDAQQWIPLGTEHRNPVRQAIRMARNQIAPDLLLLPIIAPENE